MRRNVTISALGGVGRTCVRLGPWKCFVSRSQDDVAYTGVGPKSKKVKPRVGLLVGEPPDMRRPVSSGFSFEHQDRWKYGSLSEIVLVAERDRFPGKFTPVSEIVLASITRPSRGSQNTKLESSWAVRMKVPVGCHRQCVRRG